MIRSRFVPLLLATIALASCGKSDDTPKAVVRNAEVVEAYLGDEMADVGLAA